MVIPCVYQLAMKSSFLENCLALFYYRGVDCSDVPGRLLSSEMVLPQTKYIGLLLLSGFALVRENNNNCFNLCFALDLRFRKTAAGC